MLLDFSFSNFRSFREKQTFSLVASSDTTFLERTIETGLPSLPRVLRASAIYGANAAGKSNLLRALIFMKYYIQNSSKEFSEEKGIQREYFLFDKRMEKEPTTFEINFLMDGIRYQYGFKLTEERVLEEWLNAYPKKKIQRWFARKWDESNNKYIFEFGPNFSGLKQTWERSTRPTALFLSTAVQLNSEQLRPVFSWFENKLIQIKTTDSFNPFNLKDSEELIEKHGKDFFLYLLKTADESIEDFEIKDDQTDYWNDKMTKEIFKSNFIKKTLLKYQVSPKEMSLVHKTLDGNRTKLPMKEESQGTQRFSSLAWPWIKALMNSAVLIVDELDSSLHPLMTRFLINQFNEKKSEQLGGQLIFTTHDTSLLSKEVLRRDQVWFIEKDKNNSSCFYPLTDFSPRKEEALERGYLHGRYGAIPYIGDYEI